MAQSLATTLRLVDQMTTPMMSIQHAISGLEARFRSLENATNVDASSLSAMRNQIDMADASMRNMGDELQVARDTIAAMSGEQGRFNNTVRQGHSGVDGLVSKLKTAIGVYAGIQGVKMVLGLSDELTQTTARLDMMNDGLQTTEQLQDKIFLAAQRSRGEYQATANAVAKLGMTASHAFSSNDELIAFTEQLNKNFVIGGASIQEQTNATYQLTQAMAAGRLQGDEFRSILENAPLLAQAIADEMGKPIGELKEMSSEGLITSDIIKNAMFRAADETNERFEKMPKTFGQVATSIKNQAIMAFQPILDRLNEIANSPAFQNLVNNVVNSFTMVAEIVTWLFDIAVQVFDVVGQIGGFIADTWNTIAPIVLTATAAIVGYKVAMLTVAAIESIVTAAKYAYIFVMSIFNAATATATAAQWGLNAALMANPIGIIIALVIALAMAFVMWTEQIVGVLWWCGALFKNIGLWFANLGLAAWQIIKNIGLWFANLGLTIWAGIQNVGAWFGNLGMGIWEVLKACASNVLAAFSNAWINIQIGFNAFVKTILEGVKKVIEWLNLIPGVNINTDGISGTIQGYANKMAELEASKHEYQDIGEAWQKGNTTFAYQDAGAKMNTFEYGDVGAAFDTFDVFEKGWGSEAYNAGAEIGAGLHDKMMSILPDFGSGESNIPTADAYGGGFAFEPSAIESGVNNIDANTGRQADYNEEEYKLWRDIAERDTINRFTTAEVSVTMGGVTNNVSSDMDLDGIISYVADGVEEALLITAEGVYA